MPPPYLQNEEGQSQKVKTKKNWKLGKHFYIF